MELDEQEQRDGMRWFFVAGIIAILLSIVLKTVDDRLASSSYDKDLGATLRALRTAQASLPSGVPDSRQRSLVAVKGE